MIRSIHAAQTDDARQIEQRMVQLLEAHGGMTIKRIRVAIVRDDENLERRRVVRDTAHRLAMDSALFRRDEDTGIVTLAA